MDPKEFLLAEIAKDEVESERQTRVLMLGLARAWDDGRAAAPGTPNPYADA